MQWGSVSEFFAMGGYGLYVWGSYGVTALVLLLEVVLVVRRASNNSAVGSNDDSGGPDSYYRFTAPEDGEFLIQVYDHLRSGGPSDLRAQSRWSSDDQYPGRLR